VAFKVSMAVEEDTGPNPGCWWWEHFVQMCVPWTERQTQSKNFL